MTTKILFVDDEPVEKIIRQSFRKEIKSGTYELVFALDGKSALDIIKADPTIDLVLTDINMPGMDGLELLHLIKEERPWITTIVISAYYGNLDNIRAAMNLGAFDFIQKPVDFDDLQQTLKKAICHIAKQKLLLEKLRYQPSPEYAVY